jgi:biotin carboxyl carrier protein
MTRRRIVGPAAGGAPEEDQAVVDPASPEATRLGRGAPAAASVGLPRPGPAGSFLVEVVVDGWRFELQVADADREELRRRASLGRDRAAATGPTEIRAMIPGKVADVRVSEGDEVAAGQGLMVVEAMKMQNELRAPRPGVVERVAVAAGATIELGDLLLVLR